MVVKTLTYKDFDGNERTESFYFNLTPAELVDLQSSLNGGLNQLLDKIVKENNQSKIIEYFKKIVLMSYGEKSLDGRNMIKNDKVREDFQSTMAYSDIFMELATNAEEAAAFVNGIVPPKEEQEKYLKKMQALENKGAEVVQMPAK